MKNFAYQKLREIPSTVRPDASASSAVNAAPRTLSVRPELVEEYERLKNQTKFSFAPFDELQSTPRLRRAGRANGVYQFTPSLFVCLVNSTKIINHILAFMLAGLRPLLGPAACRFYPTCGNYALQQLKNKNLIIALWLIAKRLLRCSPLG